MTHKLVKSVKAMGDLCQILNRNRGTHADNNFNFVKETDLGVCPYCGMKIVKHIVMLKKVHDTISILIMDILIKREVPLDAVIPIARTITGLVDAWIKMENHMGRINYV